MEPPDKRIKFCRYCDGVIEWGTKKCPHCGETLEVVEFDDLEFIPVDKKVDRGRGLRGHPVVEPVEPGNRPPVVKPISPSRKKQPPVVKPIGGSRRKPPPVVKPIAPSKEDPPPVMKPLGPGRRKGPPVVKPIGGPADDGPPVVAPLDDSSPPPRPGPASPDLPAGIDAVVGDCPVCEAEMEGPEDVAGVCSHCGQSVCYACLMRANGVRVSTSSARNVERWSAFASKARPSRIRCPACGQTGVE